MSPTRPPFPVFLEDLRAEALTRGIRAETLDLAFAGLDAEPVVVARDRAQPEAVQSLDDYVAARVTPRTVSTARAMLVRHKTLLERVHRTYGIPPALMVAIWGLESNFGRFVGTYPTVKALVTLAYDGRRPLFRAELFHVLTILDQGAAPLSALRGSWAGAMGQPQFMPSSFLRHAVDFDGDGRTDIWSSLPDVFGSMANYLKDWGWTGHERWGREVAISKAAMARIDQSTRMRADGCRALREMTEPLALADWTRLGVTLPGGGALPAATPDLRASLVRGRTRHFLVYGNYEALIGYNCSNSYAVSVGVLADRLVMQ